MYARILKRFRDKIRAQDYVMTGHARQEMKEDRLSIFDVENAVLTGSIVHRQKDEGSAEWKYLIRGQATTGETVVICTRLSLVEKMVIITVYEERSS